MFHQFKYIELLQNFYRTLYMSIKVVDLNTEETKELPPIEEEEEEISNEEVKQEVNNEEVKEEVKEEVEEVKEEVKKPVRAQD